ncbi:hypothetical protein CEXT_814461 [Caerostris extrusa]|uniref:Uncharacterized protein n=1 Tax=Caerostris extrusa TaxID=172846 RepID=A0AAV4NC84_CAEEX|nr:hypothetical protein CEXT_814461 [Caerostris extrusa]
MADSNRIIYGLMLVKVTPCVVPHNGARKDSLSMACYLLEAGFAPAIVRAQEVALLNFSTNLSAWQGDYCRATDTRETAFYKGGEMGDRALMKRGKIFFFLPSSVVVYCPSL